MKTLQLAIIGDFNPGYKPHSATNDAIEHCRQNLGLDIASRWIPTDRIEEHSVLNPGNFNAFWIAPGSPYKNMANVLDVIEYSRLNNIPMIGTCGGFQHMVIEYARNVLNITDAAHAEYDPYASRLVVRPLECSLAGTTLEVDITDPTSKTFAAYNASKALEKYHCNFGLNPEYQQQLHDSGFRVVASDKDGEARVMELTGHPFFVATLFVPQDNSTLTNPHPLIKSFFTAIADTAVQK